MGGASWLGSFGWLSNARSADVPWYLKGGVSAANCLAAYKAVGAASLAASYVNLANPGTYDLTAPVAPIFNTATGWTFTGTQYLSTPAITITESITVIIRFDNATVNATPRGLFGITDEIASVRFSFDGGTDDGDENPYRSFDIANCTAQGALAPDTEGIYGFKIEGTYKNGILTDIMTPSNPTPFTTSDEMYIGALNKLDVLYRPFSGNIQAAVVYNVVISNNQMLAVSNAMAAL